MGAPFLFLNLAGSGWIGFHKKKNRQAERILLCFRLPVDWVCVPETMWCYFLSIFLICSLIHNLSNAFMVAVFARVLNEGFVRSWMILSKGSLPKRL